MIIWVRQHWAGDYKKPWHALLPDSPLSTYCGNRVQISVRRSEFTKKTPEAYRACKYCWHKLFH